MHVIAEGPLKKLLFIIVAFALVILVGTWLEPFTAEYEVKTAGKIACNSILQNIRYNEPHRREWEATFVQKARVAGVMLTNEQYNFEPGTAYDDMTCHFVVAWRSTTPLIFIGDLFDLPPMKLLHRLDYVHKVKKNW
ncbi:MAG TPA: hypothetical protein VGF99_11780 [Myxococcota bacterium]